MKVNAELQVEWRNMDVGKPPTPELCEAVAKIIQTELPQPIRDAWSVLTLEVDDHGSVKPDDLLDFVNQRVEDLNLARYQLDKDAPRFTIQQNSISGCRYVYVNCAVVCKYDFKLDLGEGVWEINNPPDPSIDPVLGLVLSWSFKLGDVTDSSVADG